MAIRVLTCSEVKCQKKVAGKGSFAHVAEKNGWKVIARGFHKYYVCDVCAGKMDDSEVKYDNTKTSENKKTIMENLKDKVKADD